MLYTIRWDSEEIIPQNMQTLLHLVNVFEDAKVDFKVLPITQDAQYLPQKLFGCGDFEHWKV